jgi:RHS repeat-associated protein
MEEFCPQNPPRRRVYCRLRIHTIKSTVTSSSSTNGFSSTPGNGYSNCSAQDGFSTNYSSFSAEVFSVFQSYRTNCDHTNTYSGTQVTSNYGLDSRAWNCNDPGSGCSWAGDFQQGLDTDSETVMYGSIGGVNQWGWSVTDTTLDVSHVTSGTCGVATGWLTNSSVSNYISGISMPDTSGWDLTSTCTSWTYTPSDPSTTGSSVWQLEDEYTDRDLYNVVMQMMGPYSGSWMVPGWDDVADQIAYSFLDETQLYGELQKMKYHFAVVGAKPGNTYRVSWDLVTWDLFKGTVSTQHKVADAWGTGDQMNPVYTADQEALPPYWDEDLDWGSFIVSWVDNVSVSHISNNPPAPGTGIVSGYDRPVGCGSCGAGSSGNGSGSGGIMVEFALGQAAGGYSAGSLLLSADQPTPALATAGALLCTANNPAVQVVQASNQIRQVRAPQTLVDIITDNAFSYEMRYYLPSQFSNTPDANGLYDPIGSPTPFVTWTVQNPDASTNTFNRLQITETRGTDNKVTLYTYNASSFGWTIDYPGGLREDQTVVSTSTNAPGSTFFPVYTYFTEQNYSRVVTTTVRVPGGADQFKVRRVYQKFTTDPQGLGFEALVQEVFSPDSHPKTNTYSYYSTFETNRVVHPLQMVVRSDGSWRYYDYLSDGSGRLSHIYSGFGDLAAPSSGAPDTNQCRYAAYDYTPVSGADDGTLYPNSPRTLTTYLRSQITSKRYRVIMPGEVDDIECQRPSALWNDSDNLVTVTKYFTSGPNTNRVQSVLNPDGTMSVYSYSQATDGSETNTLSRGQPSIDQTSIVDGTIEVTVLGPVGQMLSRSVKDILSGAVLQQDIYGNFDSLSRPQLVTHIDGTTETMQYACCGLDSTTDRDGATTQFSYDAMKRQIAAARLNVTTTSVLDAPGRTLQTIRTGSDNSQVILSQSAYDLAGRLLSETNGLGGVTSYTETNDPSTGASIRATTNADGGTRIEAYYLDGSLKQVSGTAAHQVQYLYGVDSDGPYTTESKVTNTGGTNEWTKTSSDLVGHTYKTLYPNTAYSLSSYNNAGQLVSQVDPDGVATLYQYNGKGEIAYTAVDTNRNGAIDFGGNDQITSTISDVVSDHGTMVRRSRTYVWGTLGANISNLISVAETSTNGLNSWQTSYRDANTAVTNSSQTSYGTGGSRSVTSFAPDNSYAISLYSYGRLTSATRYDSLGNQLSSVAYSYDPHGRQGTVTDARNGTATYSYNSADLVASVTLPNPGTPGGAPQTTTTFYNRMLQATNVVNPDGTGVTNTYLLTGELSQTWGTRTYPAAYTYDYAGRMKTMQTWQNYPSSGSALTTWYYDPYRGFLTNKVYNDGKGPLYTYTPAGRMQTRTWARGVTTTYSYDNAGALSTMGYSDSTPGVSYAYDRLGRQSSINENGITTALAYNLAGELLSEAYSGGTLAGFSVTNGFDQFMRRTNLTALNGASVLVKDAFGYDNASRLQTVTDNSGSTAYSAAYNFVANSPLVSQIAFKSNAVTRMTTSKTFDFLNRLTQISSVPSGSAAVSFTYSYNNANQRAGVQLGDGSYWRFGYDSLGQVTSGHKYFADETPVAGQQFDYAFDTIGNRTQTKAGGDAAGANQRVANYYANLLNQYTNRDVPGAVDVMGVSIATNTVTVNGQTAYRKGEYFRQQLNVNNASSAVWSNITVSATGQSSQSGNQFVPKTQEQFSYDLDGNLTNDGRWYYTWDAENRLVSLTNNTSVGPQQGLRFEYDAKGRRIHKQVWGPGSGSPTNDVKFLYDGWNVVAILSSPSSLLESFLWGLDLSGSPQGSGGVGGLLEVVYYGASPTNCFVAFDGNGNVAALVNATNGTSVAQYEYAPFGELLRATGPMAKANPFRFSTKQQDDETDLLCYSYRYYNPSTGAWFSRDPIGEAGGLNVSGFLANGVTGSVDPFGLEQFQIWASAFIPHAWFLFPYPNGGDPLAVYFGDGRSGPAVNGSARAFHLLTIETDPSKSPVITNTSGAGISITLYKPGGGFPKSSVAVAKDTAPPLASVTRTEDGCVTIVQLSADTSDPLVSWAPSLHYDYTLRFFANSGRLVVSGSHGRYPAFDLIINGAAYVGYIPKGIDDQPAALYFPRMDVDLPPVTIQKYPCCSE